MEKVLSDGRTNDSTKENGNIIPFTDLVLLTGTTAASTEDNIEKTLRMGQACLNGK
jgi:hypothetical protein